MNDEEFQYLKDQIRTFAGLDLDGYKQQQIRRRLEGYVQRVTSGDVQAYCDILKQDRGQSRDLVDYLAINVSEFFRDPAYFTYIRNEVLPKLKRLPGRLNIWSAACSCGQEPYSLTILLEENGFSGRYRILATDIDTSALEKARQGGPYGLQDVRNLEPGLLNKYFKRSGDAFHVDPRLAGPIQFRMHNLQSDRYERGYDFIVCRNVIIYFSEAVRNHIFSQFHQALSPGGILFIGGSEAILRPADFGFEVIRPSFYRKIQQVNPAPALTGIAERR